MAFPTRMFAAMVPAFLVVLAARAEVDRANFDPSVKPQDDFYRYADGGWTKTHPTPPAYTAWGAGQELVEHNRKALHVILEREARATHRTQIEQQVGDLYASGMNEAAIEAAGIVPIRPELDRIDAIRTPADVEVELARLHRMDVNVGFAFDSEQDPKNSDMMIAGAGQAGLGLPERGYYLRSDKKSVRLRDAYTAHVGRILALGGASPAEAQSGAQSVMRIESALARGSRSRVDLRDPIANYNKMTVADAQKRTPHFGWTGYFAGMGLAAPAEIDLGQPEFFSAFDAIFAGAPVADWRAYLRWHYLHSVAPLLGAAFVDENFQFYGKTLTGTPQILDRWKRVLGAVDGSLGEALGKLYVAEYFPPESKARMLALVGSLRDALHDRLEAIPWMDEATRAKALAKLAAFTVKIGYPDKWIDYSRLSVDRGPYVLNMLRAREFNVRRELDKIGRPVDRTEWEMTPPTVNAYYDPLRNEIVFPAGILQPPFFDAKADDAVNYGAIGAVIGHEMTHGFDDQGRQFDGHGNLSDWWTPASAARFKERAAEIVKQFDGYVAVDDLHVNGSLTQGENIADLGGLKIAYAALEKALAGGPRGKIDGFTPEQRFFLSFAAVWRTNQRPEALRLQVNTDPHAPARFRVDGPLSNLDEFAAAFDVPEGAPMRRPAAERVAIW